MRPRRATVFGVGIGLLAWGAATLASAGPPASAPFAKFDLPDAWEARFWADPDVKALLSLDARRQAALVPIQSGIHFCRCPACAAGEGEDPLTWSVSRPEVLTCKRCGIVVPNETYPAKDEKEKKVPEVTIEVLRRVIHHYPYHVVEPEAQLYPEERLYLNAKRDDEARQFLSKAALYAAVRHRDRPAADADGALARLACVLILRFAQVYPAYATHFDQPGSAKAFQQADLPPPYRLGYRTGKWEWSGNLEVPLNLVIAYALVRDGPWLEEAGRVLGDPRPSETIERDLFRASAEFTRAQTEEYSERSLAAYRGMFAVGRLLDDAGLLKEARARLDGFAERGFYHDGLWRQGDRSSHRRILGQIDGWLARLLNEGEGGGARPTSGAGFPLATLARAAGSAFVGEGLASEVERVSWPPVLAMAATRRPVLLGGAGLARLAVGAGGGAIDLDVRSLDNLGAPHYQRQAIRLAVGGRPVLGDLDEESATETGWDRATASHNTVVVDGLNQREELSRATEPALGGAFTFFAADPDFQVAAIDDPRAYPRAATRYRQTTLAASGKRGSFAMTVFEVHGGRQHDQIFHAVAGSTARWRLSPPPTAAPASLLPRSIPRVATMRAEDGRWFVQAYGEFRPRSLATLDRPASASLEAAGSPGVRIHILGDLPATAITATTPDGTPASPRLDPRDTGRDALLLRRRAEDDAPLKSTFVTVFEPWNEDVAPLRRVGRVASNDGAVVVYLETEEGREHLIVNLTPGKTRRLILADGSRLTTDGLAVRVSDRALILAGGTFAETGRRRVEQVAVSGTILRAVREESASASSRGWFESDRPLPHAPALAGRTLLIRHGDLTTRGWTLTHVENTADGARLYVREEPGFALSQDDGTARYYQFPRFSAPGPHRFTIPKITRSQ